MSATEPLRSTPSAKRRGMSLAGRVALLILALFVEKFTLNFFVDTRMADSVGGAGTLVRLLQHIGLRFAVPFILTLGLFVLVGDDPQLARFGGETRGLPLRGRGLLLHLLLLAALAASLTVWYGPHGIHLPRVALSLLIAVAALLALLTALAPLEHWRRGAAVLGIRWVYAAALAAVASAAFTWSQTLWSTAAEATFHLVRLLLLPVLPALHADPAARVLAADHFAIYVAPYCSGLEGVALMLTFSSAWLLYFRKEYVFPRALLLVPAGLLLIFILNAVRIAALMLIGNAGHPGIALYGFHSQAGWIIFNCAACALVLVSRRSRWLTRSAGREAAGESTENPTAAYLLPFLAVLAAGMIARAISNGFETWDALRLFAAVPCLMVSWPRLRNLDWRFGWRGIATGLVMSALWLEASRLLNTPHGVPPALTAMTPVARSLWIGARAVTAILVLPLAEELAYRGYLLRRLMAEDFEAVRFESVRWTPILLTAVVFGVLHGALWLPGIAAGIAYGWILVRTGRMGEAVAAHVTCNALLSVCVLAASQWQLW